MFPPELYPGPMILSRSATHRAIGPSTFKLYIVTLVVCLCLNGFTALVLHKIMVRCFQRKISQFKEFDHILRNGLDLNGLGWALIASLREGVKMTVF